MSNGKNRGAVFRQSMNDFPCSVELGKNTPSFGLYRFNSALRFVPPDDEGFSLRGDKKRLVYKGRRRSHRFTILGNTAFEYDCILEREPESNVVSLIMEGAENFDFFRQPDFVADPFLKSSFAVYKKETLLGEGTGKMCHIHRPLIIDAHGRRVWGDLSVCGLKSGGNELLITIPEKWLAEAAYPVIVDPVVGTTTVGSQTHHWCDDGEEFRHLAFELSIPVNRFLVPETINGLCTAFVYTSQDDDASGGRPVLYSDSGNRPFARRSTNEGLIDLRIVSGKPAGWRSATFQSNNSIASGTNIWFGVCCEYMWYPRFDYGATCHADWWDEYESIPDNYPVYSWSKVLDYKLSMYFDYTSAQNYVRTITQGVSLADSLIKTADYRRSTTQTARVNSALSRFETFYRKCAMNVRNTMSLSRFPSFYRIAIDNVRASMEKWENRTISRMCVDDVNIQSESKRIVNVIRIIQDGLKGLDSQSMSLLYVRSVTDTAVTKHTLSHIGSFVRGLLATVGSKAETSHEANYYRFHVDTVQAKGSVYRGLLLFVRIVTDVFIRDYIFGRFLKARSELVLKSPVCREIILESKIG
jgi:hypothetical protein